MNTRARSIVLLLGLSLALVVGRQLADQPEPAFAAPDACVPGPHSGAVTADQEWCVSGNPHYVTGSVAVGAGATLTIYPGVTVHFGTGQSLSVYGTLIATGTSDQRIVFTSSAATPQPGDWGSINANGGSTVSLAYCDVGYGGAAAGNRGIYIATPNVSIESCRIHDTLGDGVRIQGDGVTPVLAHVAIDRSTGWPIHQSTIDQNPTYTDVTLLDNATDALLIDATPVNRNVTLDGSPAALNGAPIYYGGGGIWNGNTLTVTAGTTLKFAAGGGLSLGKDAALIAEGTPELPIIFTSQDATPHAGDWGKINVDGVGGGAKLRLAYCELSYGGVVSSPSHVLYSSASDVQVRHCRIHHSLGGVWFNAPNLAPVLEDVEIDHNASWPVHQTHISMTPTYIDLDFHDNATDALSIANSNVARNVILDGSPTALNGAPIYYGGGAIGEGWTLTVTPGTTIKMRNSSLSVPKGATLIAEGTPDLPITFTSQAADPQPGDWGKINIDGAGGGVKARLAYCDVGYGGASGNPILYSSASDVQIRHCRIHHSLGMGVFFNSPHLSPVLEDVEIDHVASWPVHQTYISNTPTYIDLNFHHNGTDALSIANSNVGADVILDGSPAALNGAPIYYGGGSIDAGRTLTVTPGTTIKMGNSSLGVSGNAALIAAGTPELPITFTSQALNPQPGDWGSINANANSVLRLTYCEVGYAGNAGTRALYVGTSDAEIHHCAIHHSLTQGMIVANNTHNSLQNVALVGNGSHALAVWGGTSVVGHHLTLASSGSGAYVATGASLNLTNTIVSLNTTGLAIASGGTANLTQTLWDRNTTPVVGIVNETGHLSGPAGFDLDGYHLTRYSAALGQAIDAGVADDIDGEARPVPAGTAPDLGADEFPYVLGEYFAAEKVAFDPQWVVAYDPGSGEAHGLLRQRYLLRYAYGSTDPNPPALTVTVTDTLPSALSFEAESHNPAMGFSRVGQDLNWQTTSPVQAGETGEILLSGLYEEPEPGATLDNRAGVSAGSFHYDLDATTQVPLFAPLITSPENGEICPDPSGNLQVQGAAQAGALIRIYENDTEVVTTTAGVDGTFSVSYPSPHAGIDDETELTAAACAPSDPTRCSARSQSVTLTKSLSFWCPQRSTWSDVVSGKPVVFRFRNRSGWFSTQDWVINGLLGFFDTHLSLYTCDCPAWTGTTAPPTSVWVVADGVTYTPSGAHPWYTFNITGGAHTVVFWAECGSSDFSSEGDILIDPDGFVFDVTGGFDPVSPTLHAVAGVTVTAYVSMSEWGGWVPWPAHLYNSQENPQVTGDDGYFAFFTPPGAYYLQVDAIAGYQSWRSPVIEVITQVVHVNVPYTPWPQQVAYRVRLAAAGPDPATVTATVGSAIEWCVALDGLMPPETLLALYTDPVARPLSDLGPLNTTGAWDGGRMAPGQCYRRQLDEPGAFTYGDGLGHSGTVVVQAAGHPVFLPLVIKQ